MTDAPYRDAPGDPLGPLIARHPRRPGTPRERQLRHAGTAVLGGGAAVAMMVAPLAAVPLAVAATLVGIGFGGFLVRPADSHVDVHARGLREHARTALAIAWAEVDSVTATFTPDQAGSYDPRQRVALEVAGRRVDLAGGLAQVGALLTHLEAATRAPRRRHLARRLAAGLVPLATCALHADGLRLDDGSEWPWAAIQRAHRWRGHLHVQAHEARIAIPIDAVADADLVIERLTAHLPPPR